MNKIININSLKSSHKSNSYPYLPKVNDIYTLIDQNKNKEALCLSENLFNQYKYIDKVCEVFVMSIILNADYLDDEAIKKYYFILKKIYENINENELIASYTGSFLLPKYELIKSIENENFDAPSFFKKLYDDFPKNENITYHYAASLLLKLDDFYDANNSDKKQIFDKTVNLYTSLILSTEYFDDIISVEFAKFIYLASLRSNDNEYIIKTSYNLLKDLYTDYEDQEEVIVYYCLYISKTFINDSSIISLKAIDEFKNIVDSHDAFVFKELFFLSLNNFISNQKLNDCKFAISYMKNILYNLEENEKKEEFTNIFAEMLSNCSCEQTINVQNINEYILPLISNIIKDFGYNENLVTEYCIILYNMSCLINFYNDKDSPHIDVIEELKNCAKHFDNAIPYYCLSLSNLIHLNDENFGYKSVNTIRNFLLQFDDSNTPITKNGISLNTIYIMSLANLVNEIDIDKCDKILLEIVKFIDDDSNSLYIDLQKEYNKERLNFMFQYLIALSYYVSKLENVNHSKALEYRLLLNKIDDFLSEQEI